MIFIPLLHIFFSSEISELCTMVLSSGLMEFLLQITLKVQLNLVDFLIMQFFLYFARYVSGDLMDHLDEVATASIHLEEK